MYLPVDQFSEVMTLITTLVVRTDGHPAAAVPSIRDVVAQTDPDVTVLHAAALNDLVSGQFTGPRLNAVLLSLFGAGAALLATVGLYSLLAAAVKARRRELAIRQAIGATPARLRRIVVVRRCLALWGRARVGAGRRTGLRPAARHGVVRCRAERRLHGLERRRPPDDHLGGGELCAGATGHANRCHHAVAGCIGSVTIRQSCARHRRRWSGR